MLQNPTITIAVALALALGLTSPAAATEMPVYVVKCDDKQLQLCLRLYRMYCTDRGVLVNKPMQDPLCGPPRVSPFP